MNDNDQYITREEAAYEVELACRRLGMLHIAYAKMLVKKFGKEQGTKLVLEAIKNYGELVGEQTKKAVLSEGLTADPENFGNGKSRSLPKLGLCESVDEHDGELRVKNCTMAKVWRELDEEDLGGLYCYIDTAKYMYYNPQYKLTHAKAMPCHKTDYCVFELKQTTEKERDDFFNGKDWRYLDKKIMRGDK
ncbi:L-2-amino-thiazoline-4-carboxylic acid hydrolase [Clostridium sp. 'deep sea']|uniref:L-2-amino-thiazoline-4-carboxylic acid hydrolase n=1 Tax=Clostridium sp. 'deep sea' TaxID=2779445 RepID=UPI0018969662|nr:L-2-amino-thiazoline-4-carboxylic acid hydrolase [Clostridium sp. 'deep sea']QOR34120.1 L-2-amino-thiazoline-4-carboxylic acid hydrolase [Clostridium sp. 'deep sea']